LTDKPSTLISLVKRKSAGVKWGDIGEGRRSGEKTAEHQMANNAKSSPVRETQRRRKKKKLNLFFGEKKGKKVKG